MLILGLGARKDQAGHDLQQYRPYYGFLAVCICMNERVRGSALDNHLMNLNAIS